MAEKEPVKQKKSSKSTKLGQKPSVKGVAIDAKSTVDASPVEKPVIAGEVAESKKAAKVVPGQTARVAAKKTNAPDSQVARGHSLDAVTVSGQEPSDDETITSSVDQPKQVKAETKASSMPAQKQGARIEKTRPKAVLTTEIAEEQVRVSNAGQSGPAIETVKADLPKEQERVSRDAPTTAKNEAPKTNVDRAVSLKPTLRSNDETVAEAAEESASNKEAVVAKVDGKVKALPNERTAIANDDKANETEAVVDNPDLEQVSAERADTAQVLEKKRPVAQDVVGAQAQIDEVKLKETTHEPVQTLDKPKGEEQARPQKNMSDRPIAVSEPKTDRGQNKPVAPAELMAGPKRSGEVRGAEVTPDKVSDALVSERQMQTRASEHLYRAVKKSPLRKVATEPKVHERAENAKASLKQSALSGKEQRPVQESQVVATPAKPEQAAKGLGDKVVKATLDARPVQKHTPVDAAAQRLVDNKVRELGETQINKKPVEASSQPAKESSVDRAPAVKVLEPRMANSKDRIEIERSPLRARLLARRGEEPRTVTYKNTQASKNLVQGGKPKEKRSAPTSDRMDKGPRVETRTQDANTKVDVATVTTQSAAVDKAVLDSAKKPKGEVALSAQMQDDKTESGEQAESAKYSGSDGKEKKGESRRERDNRHYEAKRIIETETRVHEEAQDVLEEATDVEMADDVAQVKQAATLGKGGTQGGRDTAIKPLQDSTRSSQKAAVISERREIHEQILAKHLGRNLGRIASMGTTHARLRLHPQELGRVDVEIQTRDGEVTLLVRTETVSAAAELNSQMNDLRASMQEHGLKLADCDVDARGFGAEDREADGSDEGGKDRSGEDNREGRGKRRRRGRGQRIKRSAIDVVV